MSYPAPSPTSSKGPVALPYITVQHDLNDVIHDVLDGTTSVEDFWVSCYRKGKKSVHGKVQVTASEQKGEVDLEARDGVIAKRLSTTSCQISCPTLDIPNTVVRIPRQTIKDVIRTGVDALDVSPTDNGLFAAGGKNGAIKCGSLKNGKAEVEPRGHVSDITAVKFFPSGEVILTSSIDLSLRVFSPLDGSNPRTFRGHTGSVTDIAIIGRGRNVVSCSRDGTARIWDVGKGEEVRKWNLGHGGSRGILKIKVGELPPNATDSDRAAGSGVSEVIDGLEGKFMACALTDGSVAIIDLSSPSHLAALTLQVSFSSSRPVDALAWSDESNLLVAGTRDGHISVWHLPTAFEQVHSAIKHAHEAGDDLDSAPLPHPLHDWNRNEAGITSLSFSSSQVEGIEAGETLLVASADGLPYRLVVPKEKGEPVKVVEEFAGYNTDPVNVILEKPGMGIFCAGEDGCLRKY